MRWFAPPLTLAAALSALPAAAQSPPCSDVKSQPEINACERQLADKSDAEMDKLYKKLQVTVDGAALKALNEAQRAWLAYREQECDFETIGEDGGSIRPMEEAICYRLKTTVRITELKQLLACSQNAAVCPF